MHELGLTQRLLEVALERASHAGATRVTALHIEIGEESDVSAESIEFYWPQVSDGTQAHGAQLVFSTAADPFACSMTAIDVADTDSGGGST